MNSNSSYSDSLFGLGNLGSGTGLASAMGLGSLLFGGNKYNKTAAKDYNPNYNYMYTSPRKYDRKPEPIMPTTVNQKKVASSARKTVQAQNKQAAEAFQKKPEPVVEKKPAQEPPKKTEPVVEKRPAPMPPKRPESQTDKRPEPVQPKKPEAVQPKKPEAVQPKKTEPSNSKAPDIKTASVVKKSEIKDNRKDNPKQTQTLPPKPGHDASGYSENKKDGGFPGGHGGPGGHGPSGGHGGPGGH